MQRYRAGAAGAAVAVVAWLLLQLVLPQQTPAGIVLLSALGGILTALTAAGIVLIYRTQRIINFAQLAMGAVGATILFEMTSRGIMPYGLALPIGILAGPTVGVVLGFIAVMLFFRHPRLVLTVVTILMLGLVVSVTGAIYGAFRRPGEIGVENVFLGPFPDKVWIVSGVPFRVAHLIGAVLAVATIAGLAVFFRRSRFGIAVRGAAENADRAALLGVNVKVLQIGVWGLAGLLASLASTLSLPITGYRPFEGASPVGLVEALAAAVVGRMTSIPVAMAASFGITMLRGAFLWAYDEVALFEVGLFAVILVGILLQRRQLIGRQVETAASWQATKEFRPTPHELMRVPGVRASRRVIAAAVVAVLLAWPWFGGPDLANFGGSIWLLSIVGLSLVVLTGWAGQISLGQFALVSVGAFAAAVMTARWGWSFWLAVPLASALGAGFAVLVGLPALRIRGLFLAVTTLAFAVVMPLVLFGEDFLGRYLPEDVRRPRLFFLDFTDERSFYYFLLAAFAGVLLFVRTLRRSRTGRVLIAIRDDEQGAQSFGIDIVRARLSAFALSGLLASFAGALLAHHALGLSAPSFSAGRSIQIFIATVIGGVSSLAGPTLGMLFFEGAGRIPFPLVSGLAAGFGPLLILLLIPGGLAQVLYGARDSVLRVVALRRHIVVPSLFADYSPEAWVRRQAPLAPAAEGHGLGVLGTERRYALPSRLWGSPEAVERALELEQARPTWKVGSR